MTYHGKFEGTAVRKLHIVNTAYHPVKRTAKQQRIINKRKKLLKAAAKALGKRILLGLCLLLAYASMFGMFLGLLLIIVKPNIWTYLLCGVSMGYAFLVLNCRAFECIGDRMGPKW